MTMRATGWLITVAVGMSLGCTPLMSEPGGSEDVGAMTHADVDDSPYIPIGDAPRRGATSAPVVVVEFADFNDCTTRGHVEVLGEMLDERSEQIQLAVRHSPPPGNDESREAALAVEAAANQDKFWEMRRLFAESCPDDPRSTRGAARDRGLEFARQLDLDIERYWHDLHQPETIEAVQRDQRLAAALDVGPATSFFVHGARWEPEGTTSVEQWEQQLDDAWFRGRALLGHGVEWHRLYVEGVRQMLQRDRRISDPRGPRPEQNADVTLGDDEFQIGDADRALTTVVAFVNPDCPASLEALRRFDALRDDYGDEVRVVLKFGWHPLYGEGRHGARALLAARRWDRGWEMIRQLTDVGPEVSSDDWREGAGAIGLDVEAFEAEAAGDQFDDLLDEHRRQMEALGLRATPGIYVNGGRWIPGASDDFWTGFRDWFDAEHQRARRVADEAGDLRGPELYRELLDRRGL